ncbi:IS30 family transposase [Paracidovorax oryzae]|uniref:IS30 family transposase n=1 Tax=Paracidovorax oryzae TaxID=862720 RepID=UPI00055356FF|nr:IS30 family transposase [Paracidovorax oryzae]
MTSRYTHLQPEERLTLASLVQQGWSGRSIARLLGRSPSTVCRELARNSTPRDGYALQSAQAACQARRRAARPAPKLHPHSRLWRIVCDLLLWRWSPQQIARTLQRMHPDDPRQSVSHETIYNAIYAYPRGELKKQLLALLRQGRSGRRPRSAGQDRRGQIPDMVSIHVRPPEADDRLMPGHWEGDLIKGANNRSAVGVLVERSTRLVLLCRMPDATAESALAAFTAKLNQVAQPMRQTLTYDQGKEMARHRELAQATGVRVYFCDPHSPWQRGSCENTNGLLRQFLPKGTDLGIHDQAALDSIADLMNNRPRETLGWRSPYKAFQQFMQAIAQQQDATIH